MNIVLVDSETSLEVVQQKIKNRNAWLSPACNPRGIAVTPPSEWVKQV